MMQWGYIINTILALDIPKSNIHFMLQNSKRIKILDTCGHIQFFENSEENYTSKAHLKFKNLKKSRIKNVHFETIPRES